jgi:hypothetical protein
VKPAAGHDVFDLFKKSAFVRVHNDEHKVIKNCAIGHFIEPRSVGKFGSRRAVPLLQATAPPDLNLRHSPALPRS